MAPGIRFITFFQGCLMRCLYCHNRDTWDTHGGKEITVEDLMKDVVTYRHFMNASGGGVTASGGEAICRQSLSATGSAPAKRGHSYLS
jgi:pyruvate formate lyase activating enzyme